MAILPDYSDVNPFIPGNEAGIILDVQEGDFAFPSDYIPGVPSSHAVAPSPAGVSGDAATVVLPGSTFSSNMFISAGAVPHLDDAPSSSECTDSDEEMDDGASDTSSSLTEIRPYEFPSYFSQHDGRLFHSHGMSPYPLPVDGVEWKVRGWRCRCGVEGLWPAVA